jgi:hypothetical protein
LKEARLIVSNLFCSKARDSKANAFQPDDVTAAIKQEDFFEDDDIVYTDYKRSALLGDLILILMSIKSISN